MRAFVVFAVVAGVSCKSETAPTSSAANKNEPNPPLTAPTLAPVPPAETPPAPKEPEPEQPEVGSATPTPDGKRVIRDVTVDGVAFTIELPADLPPHARNVGSWTDAKTDADEQTLGVFTIVLEGPLVTSLDKAKYQSTLRMSEAKWVRAESRGDGYATTNTPESDLVEAVTFTKAGDQWLKCKASRRGVRDAAARALVESICDSVTVK